MIKCIVCLIIVAALLSVFYKLAYRMIDKGNMLSREFILEVVGLIIALLMLTFMVGMMVYAFVDLFWRF